MIENPILPGCYPDPSIVRVEDDFYLISSSFSFFPGIPIFHSKNLVNWEQIGNVLDRKSQLPLTYEMISGGIFAPTIRYHDGMFYVITTNVTMQGNNFIVTAKDPKGPWSEINVIRGADGIDPSLFFDDDGKAYYTGTTGFGEEPRIWCSEIDLETMKLVGERKLLWSGALKNAASPEGPHLYKKDGWYYLMISEGGTEHFHAITISRSKEVMGEYEGYKGNPILTHRHLGKNYPICNVGHGDLVELADGSWYMVMLGSRLMGGYHKILGRETFVAPVIWEEGWPIVSYGTGKVEYTYPNPTDLPVGPKKTEEFFDDFNDEKIGFQWNYLGTPYEDFADVKDGHLRLKLLQKQVTPWELQGLSADMMERYQESGNTKECVSFIGKRQQHLKFEAITKMIFKPEQEETAGLVVLQNNAHQLRLEVFQNNAGNTCVSCITADSYVENKKLYYRESSNNTIEINDSLDNVLFLKIASDETKYSFYAGADEKNMAIVSENIDGSFLGSETAGGFVGAYIGMFGSGVSEPKNKQVLFDWFSYKPIHQ